MRGRISWVLKRALHEPLLPITAFAAILLATVTLVSLSIYTTSVIDVGVRWSVTKAGPSTTAAQVTTWIKGTTYHDVGLAVKAQAAETYQGYDTDVVSTALSADYQRDGERVQFGTRSDLQSQAKLVQGQWARPGTDPIEVTVPEDLGVKAGETLTLDRDGALTVRVAGVFATPRALYPPLNPSTSGTVPLMVPEETFLAKFADQVLGYWYVTPRLDAIDAGDLGPLAAVTAAMPDRIKERTPCAQCVVRHDLPQMLAQLDRGALIGQSTMLVPILQLLILAGYALMLTARLLADHRRMEVALLRARGAGMGGLIALSASEAVIIAAPSVLIAPFVAPHVLNAVASLPWVQAGAVPLSATPEPVTFLIAALVALAGAFMLAASAVRNARRTYVEEQSARGRGDRQGLLARAGGDVALVVVGGLAVWQLTRYGGPVASTAGGALGIDPLLVSGPALALLAGGMLGLRLVPWTSKIAAVVTSRRPGLAPALGTWQVSRRPLRYAGPALLLTMTVAIGVLSVTTATTWKDSQRDQADHQVGADLRITPPDRMATGAGAVYAALPGVRRVSPAVLQTVPFGDHDATMLALDADRLAEVLRLRPDLSDVPVAELGRRLAAERPNLKGIPLPGTPSKVSLDVRAEGEVGAELLLADALGARWQIRLSPEMTADLGKLGKPAYPLEVLGLTFTGQSPLVTVTELRADDERVSLPAGLRWSAADLKGAAKEVAPGKDGLFTVSGLQPDVAAAVVAGPKQDRPLPVVVTADLAAAETLAAGDERVMRFGTETATVRVAAVVDSLPGAPPGSPAALVDYRTVVDRSPIGAPRVTEWWATTRDGDPSAAVAALAARPDWSVKTFDRETHFAELRDNPLAGGLQGALLVGFLAAVVFAGIGFTVNAAVAARERRGEFGLLHSLGVGFRQILALLAIEQTFMVALGLGGGTLLAAGLATVVVPHLVISGQATGVTPPVLLEIPWAQTGALLLVLAAVLFLIVVLLAGSMRRRGLGQVLRAGEDG
ncbi:FtsX-like permease family protein [Nonomuraea sp. NPDC050556]|uniref:FtsX-like permease family protein n=1 Tax=Nonomuraea sp. NPDC050556 TaxID=3364369 RepID=UPI0037A225C6